MTIQKPCVPLAPAVFLNTRILSYLNILAYALIASSVLYLMTANWWMLPKLVKLFIPQIFLLGFASASVYFSEHGFYRQSFDALAALMLGVCLAVIGQTYQTGADSYQLFLVWSLLLVPWLIRPNLGVFLTLSIISQLALYLYFSQTFLLHTQSSVYLLCMNLLLLGSAVWTMHQYAVLRFVLIAAVIFMSMICMFNHAFDSGSGHFSNNWLSAIVLPSIMLGYFYSQKKNLETSLMAVGLVFSACIWVIGVNDYLFDSIGGILLLASLIFITCALITFWLKHLFPDSKFSIMPLALGAWLAGIILSLIPLLFTKSVALWMGAMCFGMGWFLSSKHQQTFFLRQLGYCLWIGGQIAVLAYTFTLTEEWSVLLVLQIAIVIAALLIKMHWFKLAVQFVVLHFLIMATFVFDHPAANFLAYELNYVIVLAVFLTAKHWQHSVYEKSVGLLIIVLLSVTIFYQSIGLIQGDIAALHHRQLWSWVSIFVLPVLVLLTFMLKQRTLHKVALWSVAALGMALIGLGYFEIFIMLVLLAWASSNHYKLLSALASSALIFWLWRWYYSLDVSLLMKSITIFSSGLAVLIMLRLLSPYALNMERVECRD